jgi:hypothetical protein
MVLKNKYYKLDNIIKDIDSCYNNIKNLSIYIKVGLNKKNVANCKKELKKCIKDYCLILKKLEKEVKNIDER